MYSRVSLLSGIYSLPAMHSLLVTIICYEINQLLTTHQVMTSRVHCFVGELSKKKQTLTTVSLLIQKVLVAGVSISLLSLTLIFLNKDFTMIVVPFLERAILFYLRS